MTHPYEAPVELLACARAAVLKHQDTSRSLLQSQLGIGYRHACDLLAQLQQDGLVTPVTRSGIRLVAPAHRITAAPGGSSECLVRMLRDLALYMIDCDDERSGGHSEFIRQMLARMAPRLTVEDVRRCASVVLRDGSESPVYSIAQALAILPAVEAVRVQVPIGDDLHEACRAVERPPQSSFAGGELSQRKFTTMMRYLDQCRLEGRDGDSRVFRWLPHDVPFGLSKTFADKGGKYWDEHVVPCALLRTQCQDMLASGVSVDQVSKWVRPYVAVVRLTEEEANYIDHVRKWKDTMPPAWEFDRDSVYARLEQSDIEFFAPTATGHQ